MPFEDGVIRLTVTYSDNVEIQIQPPCPHCGSWATPMAAKGTLVKVQRPTTPMLDVTRHPLGADGEGFKSPKPKRPEGEAKNEVPCTHEVSLNYVPVKD